MAYFLPEEYKFNHAYCFFLHDYLVNMIIKGESSGKFNINIKFDKEDKKLIDEFDKLEGSKLIKWLNENGFKDKVDMLTYKQIFAAVLTDFCHFIHTALVCSEKGKLSVTYSLLRKPFKDYLFIFEWMFAMPTDFIHKYNSKDSFNKIAIDRISPENKKRIIKKVIENIPHAGYPTEFLYDIRYNKKIPYGFEQIWQKANHIITSHKHYRTEEGNLNFVFSSLEDKVAQWSQLYLLLPGILYYTVKVCMFIYYAAIDNENAIDNEFLKRATVGYIIASKNSSETVEQRKIDDITLECKECNKKIKLNTKVVNDLKNKFTVNCDCGNEIYLFEIDKVKGHYFG